MEEKRCCICDSDIKGVYQDIFIDYTKHSKILLYEVVHKIIKRDFIKHEENLLCYSCVNRVNKYEFGIILAEQMENEIQELISQTESKYELVRLNDFGEAEEEKFEIKLADNPDSGLYDNSEKNINDADSVEEVTEDWGNEDDNRNQEFLEIYEMDDSQNKSTKENYDDSDHFIIETVPVDIKPFKVSNKSKKKRLYCEKCDILFPTLAECRRHKESEHADSSTPVQCQVCGVTCETRSKFNNHMRSHQDPIKCSTCNKEFTQKGALKRHMAIHTGEKPYQCTICGKKFIHGSSFHMHNLAHGNIREETCQICGYKLRSRSHLNRHMLIHTGEKKHECPKCGQRFAQRYNMNVHLKLHEGIKRQKPSTKHVCYICDLKFKSLKALNEHTEQFHEVEDYHAEKHLVKLENLIEDQSDIYDSHSIIDAYSNENVKVELLL